MKNLPEYLLSTPRLIAIILTLALVYLTITKTVEAKEFVAAIFLVFGYFFGSRGSESKNGKTESEIQYQASAPVEEMPSQEELDEVELLSSKYSADDNSTESEGH